MAGMTLTGREQEGAGFYFGSAWGGAGGGGAEKSERGQ